ncbi:MAG: aldo/keto reductase [Oscillospiraceae bacterium]|nr:aldo/keto reductase [Oscillospiraceae bacterium]
MEYFEFGGTGLNVSRSGFGCIPIQRLSDEDSTSLLRAAFAGGINFYDTARSYTTSESKLSLALGDVRKDIIIATKTGASNAAGLREHISISLKNLQTDYIDIYQLHNPSTLPVPDDESGLYDELLKVKEEGLVRHIGITNHRLDVAVAAVNSGLYETMQFPMSSIASDEEVKLVELCKEKNVGFIAMKGLGGGLITNARSTFAFLRSLPDVLPIWGMQYKWQLEEFLTYEEHVPELNDKMWEIINKDRQELSEGFCRACGYCLPCPAGINIPQAARMKYLLGRTDYNSLIDENTRKMMDKIDGCIACGHCKQHCPYSLDTPELLKTHLGFYREFVKEQ